LNKRQEVIICRDDLLKQQEYIRLIRELNADKTVKYSLFTFGCQMNENDSERLAGMLAGMGYIQTQDVNESDLIIYNTCCVRENAELKVYGHLGSLKKFKKQNPQLMIAVCGCMMQQNEVVDHIREKYSHVGLIFGTHNLYKFPELLYSALKSDTGIVEILDSSGMITEGIPIKRKDGVKAWVTIMYGCNNFCSYCIVPYVRGRERSRNLEDILSEVRLLGQHNYKEITLLGQNVNSYGKDINMDLNFARLLKEVNKIEGIERIRFMTSHPKDLSDELIEAMAACEKVCEHLHLPVQAGSSRILEKMNRKYSKEQYLELCEKIRKKIPGISLTTDIIVGFPGETEEDFEDTIDIIKKVRFDSAYTFLYSKRTGTPAAKSVEQVAENVKKRRFERLVEVQNKISRELNDALAGTKVEVLVEGTSKNSLNTYTGRTRTNKIVNFIGNKNLIGKLIKVKIIKSKTWSLEGEVIHDTERET
jgi:tRNA-2-methylthio-N6-dimethylallyladenosine synthase